MDKRKKSKSSITAKLGLVIAATLFIYFVYAMIDQQRMIYEKSTAIENVKAKIEEENKLKEKLQKQREMMSSDEYVEKVAREKLDMVKRGEKIFVDINR